MAEAGGVFPGHTVADDDLDVSKLYVTPEELTALTGMVCGEEVLRYAQSLYDAACNRRSLWPCQYEQTLRLPEDRQSVLLAVTPVCQLLACAGHYGLRRRERTPLVAWGEAWYLVSGQAASRQHWHDIALDTVDYDPATGELWLASTPLLTLYTQIRVRYLAGFPQIPGRVKLHIATIANSVQQRGLGERLKYQVGRVTSEYASSSFISDDVRVGMEPFVVRALY